ncbi:lipoprotein insertase outer membrane protein LolB [Methylomagnum sp.]
MRSNNGLIRRLAVPLALMVLLPGCASLRTETAAPPLPENTQALYALKMWRLEGRIGVRTTGDAWQANLFWEHEAAQDRLRISGPLSQGMVSIIVQKDLLYINEGNGVTKLSRDPDAELRERLGFSVPLASLRYWMLGLPDPALAHAPIQVGGGATAGFRQLGWTIRVDSFTHLNNRALPQKLRVERDDVAVKLKIIADTWNTGG